MQSTTKLRRSGILENIFDSVAKFRPGFMPLLRSFQLFGRRLLQIFRFWRSWKRTFSLPNNFDEGAFAAASVKLPIENLFPWPEVEFALCDGHLYFAAHYLPF